MASLFTKLIDNLRRKDERAEATAKPEVPRARVRPRAEDQRAPVTSPAPRAARSLKGYVEVQGRTNVLVRDEDATEELLTLSEDDPRIDGIDPYNTGGFTKKELSGKKPRRR